MTEDYYGASAGSYGLSSDTANEYGRRVNRSKRILSKFNDEQKRTAWQNIKSTAIVVAGVRLVDKVVVSTFSKLQRTINKISYEPLIEGLQEYTAQLTEFQAIIQNSAEMAEDLDWEIGGSEHIDAISEALEGLNEYADLTIYKFSDMQSAFTGFVNAGLTLDDAETMAKGIASLTAFMGKGANEYASAAYMFNQAMQQGKMQYYQWRSIEQTAGIGGALSKKLLIQTAQSMGKDAPEWEELYNIYDSLGGEEGDNSFRDTLADDWLTADVLLEAMKVLTETTDDYSETALRAKGYSEDVINMAKTAFEESQKVRTFAQFMDAVVESIGTGWSRIFKSFFGDVSVATTMWTNLMNTVTDDIGRVIDKIGDEADAFVEAGGRDAITDILNDIWGIIKNIGKWFGKIFGTLFPDLGTGLASFAKGVAKVTGVLSGRLSFSKIEAGVSPVLERILNLIERLIKVLKKLWTEGFSKIWNGLKKFVSAIGPQIMTVLEAIVGWIERAADALINSGMFDSIENFFGNMSTSIDNGIHGGILGFFSSFLESLKYMFSGIDVDGIIGTFKDFLESLTGMVSDDGVKGIFGVLWMSFKLQIAITALKPVLEKIAKTAKSFNGIYASFKTIVGSVLAIVIAIYALDSIDTDLAWRVAGKCVALGIALGFIGIGLFAVRNQVVAAASVLGFVLLAAAIIAGIVALCLGLKGDWKDAKDILGTLCTVMLSLAALLMGLAVVIGIVGNIVVKSRKAAISTGKQMNSFFENVKSIFSSAHLDVTFGIGDKMTKRILAVSVLIFTITLYTKVMSEAILGLYNVVRSSDGVDYTLLMVMLVTMFAIPTALAVFLGSESVKTIDTKQAWKLVSVMLGLASVFAIIVGAIWLLSYTATKYQDTFGLAIGSLILIYGAIAILVKLLNKVSKFMSIKKSGSIFAIATEILAIAGAAWIIADALVKLQSANVSWKSVGIIGSILGALAAFVALLKPLNQVGSKSTAKTAGQMLATSFQIATLASAVYTIARSVALLAALDINKVEAAGDVVRLILNGLIALVLAINITSLELKSAKGVLKTGIKSLAVTAELSAVIAAVYALLGAIWLATTLPENKVVRAFAAVGAILSAIISSIAAIIGLMKSLEKLNTSAMAKFAGVMAAFDGLLAGIVGIIGIIALIAWMTSAFPDANFKMATGMLVGVTAGVLAVFAAIAAITKFLLNGEVSSGKILATMAGLGILIGAVVSLAGMVAMIGQEDQGTLVKGGIVIGVLLAIITGMFIAIAKFSQQGAGVTMKAMGLLLSIAGIVIVLANVMDIIGSVADKIEVKKLWAVMGAMAAMVILVAALIAVFAVISSSGIGAAALGIGIGVMLAITACILGLSKAFLNFASGIEAAGTGVDNLVQAFAGLKDVFDALNAINFDTFEDTLDRLLAVMEDKLPRINELAGSLDTMPTNLILVQGDMKAINGSIAISDSANFSGVVSDNTVSGNISGNTADATVNITESSAKEIGIASGETTYDKLYGGTKGVTRGIIDGLVTAQTSMGFTVVSSFVNGLADVKNSFKNLFSKDSSNDDNETDRFEGWSWNDQTQYKGLENQKEELVKNRDAINQAYNEALRSRGLYLGKDERFQGMTANEIYSMGEKADQNIKLINSQMEAITEANTGSYTVSDFALNVAQRLGLAGASEVLVTAIVANTASDSRERGISDGNTFATELNKALNRQFNISLTEDQRGMVSNTYLGYLEAKE